MASWNELMFQDASSPLMEQLVFFHDHTLLVLILITILIGYSMFSMMLNKSLMRFLLEGQWIEMIWTVLPVFILVFIAFPSLHLLYMLDEVFDPFLSIKVVGHQWYWSYEYSDFLDIEFDSYMMNINDLEFGEFRLLDVDNRLILPYQGQIRFLISAADVLHSWTVPSLGVKVDAVPGRLNQIVLYLNRVGLFYGQCSEICGANHSFMPIVVESIPMNYFINWVLK
uniref:Cytochrome c oxidase subunit 2 n=1 Tax=Epiperipatus biolleyi TaxID=172520 RepID=A3QU23_EPIBI|nr:cytochrome c oxidase subunit II [Epiperipatus biolleyi]ABF93294.1 cytochrome c oxidase subunit II [Epiperipatus biolleyi]